VPTALSEADVSFLGPGETTEQEVDLTDLYGVKKHGKYKVQALYYNNTDLVKNKKHTWRGVIASELSEIKVD